MRFLLSTAVAFGPLVLGTAFAQTSAQNDPVLVSDFEIVVTAPGPERKADELIGNATLIGRDDILKALEPSLGDTLDKQPGVSTTFFGPGASRPVLRGLGAERVLVLTNGIGVIDVSAASPDHQVAADGIDAEKIEILRGPAALAYGGQAIGGVVNVIDGLIVERAPDRAFGGDAFAALNDVSEGSEAAAHAHLSGGPLVLSLSASSRNFDPYDIPGFAESDRLRAAEAAEEAPGAGEEHEEAKGALPNSFVETETYGVGLSWIGDRVHLGVAVRRQEALYGLIGHAHEEEEGAPEEAEEEHGEESPFIDLEQTRYDVRGSYRVDNGVLTDINATFSAADYTHTEFEAPGEPGTVYETEGYEGRIEIGHAVAGLEGALGLQFLDKELNARGDEAFITQTDTQSLALFLYESKDWQSGFGIEGGLRLEETSLDNALQGEKSFTLVSGSLGARKAAGRWFFGAQAAYTERAPNESELFANGAHAATQQFEIGDRNLERERGVNVEATARWTNDAWRFGVNGFVNVFEDFIYLAPGATILEGVTVDEVDGLPVFLFAQESATFVGGEAFARYVTDGPLGARWTLGGALDFVDAELDGGGSVPLLPPVTLGAEAQAKWTVLTLGADLTIAAEQDDRGADRLPVDGYTRLDLRAAAELSSLGLGRAGTQAFVELRNATDEEIRYATSTLADLAPAPGRNLRIGLRAAW